MTRLLLTACILSTSCGYSEAEMNVQRDRARMLQEALTRLQDHYNQCEDMLVKEVQDKKSSGQ